MKSHLIPLVAAALMLAGCGERSSEPLPPADGAGAETSGPATARVRVAPIKLPRRPAIAPNTEHAVYTVDSVVLARPPGSPNAVLVRASGTVRGVGWTNLKLVEVVGGDGRSDIRNYKFMATSPAAASKPAMQRARAELRVDALPASVKAIRVVSESNEVTAALP